MSIYWAKRAQIAILFIEKVNIIAIYLNFVNIFLKKFRKILLNFKKANKYAI